MPKVSIGLPVYNGENYLEEAIDSILAQTFDDFELIIFDNASIDRTEKICRDYASKDTRIVYHRNDSNLGAIVNYNRVFEKASGKYFKWAAHDDIIAPAFLERCVEVLDQNPEVVLSFPGIHYIDEKNTIKHISQGDLSLQADTPASRLREFVKYQRKNTDIFWAVFGLMRTDALQKTGLLGSYVASDQILLMKLLLQGQFHQIPEYLYCRREHPLASTIILPKSRTYRKRAEWYDGKNGLRVVLPNWRLIPETFSAVRKCQIMWHQKHYCYCAIAYLFALRWKRLIREIISIPSQVLGYG